MKTSFAPISDENTTILILGSMPGDKSLEMNAYYAHPRNRFWQIIAALTQSDLPNDYEQKIQLLLQNRIGLWDLVHQAQRVGSLDSQIKNESPNDIDDFISNHNHLKTIVFNGKMAEKLFNKYFKRKVEIQYLGMPSTSPANAHLNLEKLILQWKVILE
jgi:hypoxanthine-DNA glycosylase